MTDCRHIWVIEALAPGKAMLLGVCKHCAEERSFPAHLPDELGPLTQTNRVKRHKPAAWKGSL